METNDYTDYADYEEDYFIDDEYVEDNFEGAYLPQQMSCLPVILVVLATATILILAVSKVEISIPEKTGAAINPSVTNGLGGGSIAALFTPEVQYWSANIMKWSQQTGLDANMIATVIQIESCGDPFAKSSAGAMGLFQVMPYHFESGEDPYKPAINARRGLGYLGQALAARDGIVRLGFAGYNGGITGAKRPESQWANETQRYVYWGSGIYEDTINGKATSERLNEWLSHGGASLCKQAAQRLGIEP